MKSLLNRFKVGSWRDRSACVQETAYEDSQKYKEGKFIIEKARVIKVRPEHAHRIYQPIHPDVLRLLYSEVLQDGDWMY